MEVSEIRDKSLVDYLSSLGIQPNKKTPRGFQYLSPFRDEQVASFYVFNNNRFYDFGSGAQGSIIDFIMHLKGVDATGAIRILRNGVAIDLPKYEKKPRETRKGIEVMSVNEITSEDILSYTDTRCIPRHLIKKYCKAVSFRFPLGKRPGRIYTSCGFSTDSGSFEIRDSFFKVSTSPKNVSTFKGDKSRYAVYEGFMDFLSALAYFKKESFKETVIVLNSLSFITALIPILQDAESVDLYLDEGLPVEEKIVALREANVPIQDCRDVFAPYQDMNDFLVAKNCVGGK